MSDPGDEHQEHVAPAPASGPGMPDAGVILARLTDELAQARARQAAIRAAIDEATKSIGDNWERYWAIDAEVRALNRQIARNGGGFDADFYHRRRERSPSTRIRDGFMHHEEDLR